MQYYQSLNSSMNRHLKAVIAAKGQMKKYSGKKLCPILRLERYFYRQIENQCYLFSNLIYSMSKRYVPCNPMKLAFLSIINTCYYNLRHFNCAEIVCGQFNEAAKKSKILEHILKYF